MKTPPCPDCGNELEYELVDDDVDQTMANVMNVLINHILTMHPETIHEMAEMIRRHQKARDN